jgi:hypothetical protein
LPYLHSWASGLRNTKTVLKVAFSLNPLIFHQTWKFNDHVMISCRPRSNLIFFYSQLVPLQTRTKVNSYQCKLVPM